MTGKLRRGFAFVTVFVLVGLLGMALPVQGVCAVGRGEAASPRYFIALGDSISSGFGLPGYSPRGNRDFLENRHTSVLFEKMKYEGFVDKYLNMAISGLDTPGLLWQLTNLDEEAMEQFGNARIITINIGGNNILTPFLDFLDEIVPDDGMDELISGVMQLMGALEAFGRIFGFSGESGEGGDSQIAGLLPGFLRAYFGIRAIFGGGAGVYASLIELVSIMMGDLPPDLMEVLEVGVETFAGDFEKIMAWLYENAPNAEIIVNTIYNPIPHEIAGLHAPISQVADGLIMGMNEVIEKRGETLVVVDLHSYFVNRLDLSQLNLDFGSEGFSVDIIHPNAKGHNRIAELQHYYFYVRFTNQCQNGIICQELTERGSYVYAY